MDELDFPLFLESTGREFEARIQRAGFYQHPTGTGDAREDIVRQYLQDVLPRRFSVDRGKIFDSAGRLSREFDVIIAEAHDVAPAMSLAGRRIVPVEAVCGVIEVKSVLSRESYETFIRAVTELDQMRRHYRPLHPLHGVHDEAVMNGLPPQDNRAGKVWSGIIAFDAPNGKTLAEYFASRCDGFWFICVPGREFVSQRMNPPGCFGAPYGLKSLPLAVWLIMDLVSKNTRPSVFLPDFSRYRQHMVEAIGDLTGGWMAKCEEVQDGESDSAV